mmetsp:Transcript_2990/g.9145  ORF Transcript_2990/g.9145 Transcript_2990/m.9145 type:complete len:228 (+) Transcript_2990:316-999(+)
MALELCWPRRHHCRRCWLVRLVLGCRAHHLGVDCRRGVCPRPQGARPAQAFRPPHGTAAGHGLYSVLGDAVCLARRVGARGARRWCTLPSNVLDNGSVLLPSCCPPLARLAAALAKPALLPACFVCGRRHAIVRVRLLLARRRARPHHARPFHPAWHGDLVDFWRFRDGWRGSCRPILYSRLAGAPRTKRRCKPLGRLWCCAEPPVLAAPIALLNSLASYAWGGRLS